MNFRKYFYGSREAVLFFDETGDPSLRDANNPIFAFGGCAVLGADLESKLRSPWRDVRLKVTGSADKPIHMRALSGRLTKKKCQALSDFFEVTEVRRISFAITDKTAFEIGSTVRRPVLELCLENTLRSAVELLSGETPVEALAVVFEDGPLANKILPLCRNHELNRNDGIRIPVSWGILSKKEDEPGLEIADYIAHSTAGYMRNRDNQESRFHERYRAIFPRDKPNLGRGFHLDKVELIGNG